MFWLIGISFSSCLNAEHCPDSGEDRKGSLDFGLSSKRLNSPVGREANLVYSVPSSYMFDRLMLYNLSSFLLSSKPC